MTDNGSRKTRTTGAKASAKATEKAGDPEQPETVNEVRLVGRLSRDPEQRVLPSGDAMWTFRVVVPRAPGGRSRQTVDTLECAVWGGRVRQSVAAWAADDVVEVTGSLRRRFFATGRGPASRVEVEVTSGRLVRRGAASRREGTG